MSKEIVLTGRLATGEERAAWPIARAAAAAHRAIEATIAAGFEIPKALAWAAQPFPVVTGHREEGAELLPWEMVNCALCGQVMFWRPARCCDGFECGCGGMPIDPPVCSRACGEPRGDWVPIGESPESVRAGGRVRR